MKAGRKAWAMVAALLAATLASVPASAQSQTQNAKASVKIVKPLALTWVQDLDFGTVTLAPGSWTGATLTLSRTGALTCAAPNLICSGAVQPARYKVAGSNNQTVRISAPAVVLVNQSDPTKTLTMTVDSPGTIPLSNSGTPGVIFALGGSIPLSSDTPDGTYAGTFNVTVDY